MKMPQRVLFLDKSLRPYDCPIKFRHVVEGPESDLLDSFLRQNPVVPRSGCNALVLREPCLDHTYPDLVVVEWIPRKINMLQEFISLPPFALRLLTALIMSTNSVNELVDGYGHEAGSVLSLLEERKIAIVRHGKVRLRRPFASPISQIVTIEAKLSHTASAVRQAGDTLRFASSAFVVTASKSMPGHRVRRVRRDGLLQEARLPVQLLPSRPTRRMLTTIHWKILSLLAQL